MGSDEKSYPIKLSELREVIGKIFDHIEHDLGIETIDLWDNYYYSLGLEETFKEVGIPPNVDEIGIGDLIDDWDYLKPLLSEDREMAVSLLFMHVSPLLKLIAHRIGQ